jgi:hypothetical protein
LAAAAAVDAGPRSALAGHFRLAAAPVPLGRRALGLLPGVQPPNALVAQYQRAAFPADRRETVGVAPAIRSNRLKMLDLPSPVAAAKPETVYESRPSSLGGSTIFSALPLSACPCVDHLGSWWRVSSIP